jgi:hypothetical protein
MNEIKKKFPNFKAYYEDEDDNPTLVYENLEEQEEAENAGTNFF